MKGLSVLNRKLFEAIGLPLRKRKIQTDKNILSEALGNWYLPIVLSAEKG